jgi:chaperone modulatory protein CbpM
MRVESYVFSGHVIEEEVGLTLADLSRACCVNAEWLIALVDEGVLEPIEMPVDIQGPWRFSGASVYRARTIQRLQRDLGVNMAGAALALELLEEIDTLQAKLAVLESND